MRWHSNLLGLDWKPIDYKTIRRKEMETPIFKFALTEALIKNCEMINNANMKAINEKKMEPLIPEMFLPKKSNASDVGYDVRCAAWNEVGMDLNYIHHYKFDIEPTEYQMIPLGLRVLIPDGWWLKLVSRSSTFIKKHCSYLAGVIDTGYSGDLCFCLQYLPNEFRFNTKVSEADCNKFELETELANDFLSIPFGERIAQLIPVPRYDMDVAGVTNEEFDRLCKERGDSRGASGWGASGGK